MCFLISLFSFAREAATVSAVSSAEEADEER